MKQVFTIAELVEFISHRYDNPNALNDNIDGKWVALSTKEYTQKVKYLALALDNMGVQKNEKVGIMALPSAYWTIADLAIMSIGAVSVPIFSSISEENVHFEIEQTEMQTVFIGGQEPWARYENHREWFKYPINIDSKIHKDNIKTIEDLIHLGKKIDEMHPERYQELTKRVKTNDIATIIYTSGSTGIPKGAEHTQSSVSSFVHINFYQWDTVNDRYLSFLPLAHVFGRLLNFVIAAWGISIYYYNDLKNIGAACREIHPTLMIVVPRLLEKIYTKMVSKVDSAGYMKRTIGHWAFDLANQEEETTWKHLFHPIAEKLVYSNLREALGGQVRVMMSGGAPLDPHLYHFFLDIGLPIYEGWGMTEACPVTCNRIGKIKVGTIGPVIDCWQLRIDDKGEILVRGPNMMVGYYKNRAATATTIDEEGWLHTGDQGTIDDDGYVTIRGRIKEILVLSTGEKIAPVPIEHSLKTAPFIETAIVIAEKRKFASCLLVPDFEILKSLKDSQQQSHLSDEDFLESDYIKEEMKKLLFSINEHLNHWEQIQEYRFISRPLSIEKGELTPSMKIVRQKIEASYKDLIDSIYKEETI